MNPPYSVMFFTMPLILLAFTSSVLQGLPALSLIAALLQDGAAREDDVAPLAVELEDLHP